MNFSLDCGGVGAHPGEPAENTWGIKPTVGSHTIRIRAELSAGNTHISVVSNPVEIEIVAEAVDSSWGEAVGGVQCRLRTVKDVWPLWEVRNLGKVPKFKVDFRSRADQPFFNFSSNLFADQIHVQWDGAWYEP